MNTFARYAPFIQDYIYQNGWSKLRGVQNAAADAIFNTDDNVLLMAATASGKTEAAFFPILTLLEEDPPNSIGVLYIAPLKALINDQHERLVDILEGTDIKVTKWHGDASDNEKRKLLKHPSGVVQITPESLESLLINKHNLIPFLFSDLRFIVIDEVHSFLRGDRGMQTFCLIERLSKMAGCNPRRVGLSATLGNPEAAGRFLSYGTKRKTIIPKFDGGTVRWILSMEHFYDKDPQADNHKAEEEEGIEKKTDTAPKGADPGIGYIFEHTRGKKCLIFTNSREECEGVCQELRRYCDLRHEPDRFLIHHGNLSTSFRESAEEEMKDDDSLLSICATATLELGIDIGKLERAFQIDAPFTVSGFLQRMGRTGRRGNPSEMWFVMREKHFEARSILPETLPWSLVQGIALVQLYLEEKFVEPPREGRLPYSLLYHQTMSTLASCGELTPSELASRVLTLSSFERVTTGDYKLLLKHLLEIDHIEQTENGGLIVGLQGERIVNNYKFYAVFKENIEYTVRSRSAELGTIVKPPPVHEKIAIAGKVWEVMEVNDEKRIVYCEQVKGEIPAYFGDVPGDIHTRVLERMFKVLEEDKDYPYLLNHARARLHDARSDFKKSGATMSPLLSLGEHMWVLFPWLGSYSFLALERFLRLKCQKRLHLKKFQSQRPYYMVFQMEFDKNQSGERMTEEETERLFYQVTKEEAGKDFSPMDLLYPGEVPLFDKYDDYLPKELVRKGFAFGVLDIQEMKKRVFSWPRKTKEDN